MNVANKVVVSERALIARINRKMVTAEPWGKKLCKARKGSMAENNLGTYYVIDTYRNSVIDSRIEDLEKFARDADVNVMAAWETLES